MQIPARKLKKYFAVLQKRDAEDERLRLEEERLIARLKVIRQRHAQLVRENLVMFKKAARNDKKLGDSATRATPAVAQPSTSTSDSTTIIFEINYEAREATYFGESPVQGVEKDGDKIEIEGGENKSN